MTTYEQVMDALRQADAAGNTEDATRLAALAISLRPDTTPTVSSEGYMTEALRKGPASSAGTAVGLGGMVAEQLRRLNLPTAAAGLPGVPLSSVVTMAGELGARAVTGPFGPMQAERARGGERFTVTPMTQAFTQAREPVYRGVMSALGTTGAEPQTGGEKIIAGGLQATTEPLSYLFPALSSIRRMGPLAQTIMRPTEQAVVGAGAEAGGIAGEYAGGKLGYEDTGRVVGGIFGGGISGATLGSTSRSLALGGKGFDFLKNQWSRVTGTVPENELLKDVDNRISNIFNAAIDADPNIAKVIEDAIKAQKGVSLKAPGATEVKLPLSAILANNPVIDEQIRRLSATNTTFRAQYGAQYDAAKEALTTNQARLFGDPSKAVVKAAAPDLANLQARRVKSLDEQIAQAYQDQSVDPTAFGQRVASLLAKREDEARASTKPLYKEAFDIAATKNVELPAGAVDDIYNFVVGEQGRDIFKNFPSIYNKVAARFRPETTPPSAILTAEGRPMVEGGRRFAAATPDDLDSLKREINAQLRTSKDENNIRLLSELKSRVNGHINNLDPDFVAAYRNADNAYLTRVGLPFDAATLKNVDRKKFVEQIAPAIIGNKSNVSEFIRATGDEGVQVVRDAFLDSFSRSVLKNGVLDPKAAAKWFDANKGGVSLVPGLRDELQAVSKNVQQLIDAQTRLNANFQRVAGDQILSKEGVKSPAELVSRMYGDVKFTNKFMQQYGADKDSVNAARAFMLDDIINAGDPVALLNDRTKAAVFNRVFGPTYAKKVADFAVASKRLKVDPSQVAFKTETVPKTSIEEITGSPPQQIVSRFLNPVSGPLYAVTSTVSKFWARQASAATDAKMVTLLSNPSDAVKFMTALEKSKKSLSAENIEEMARIGAKYGIDWVKDAISDLTTGAARGGIQQAQPQE